MSAQVDEKAAANNNNEPRVHFDKSDDSFDHDSNIMLTAIENGYNVYLGFLRINHWYRINFSFTLDYLNGPLFRGESEPASNIKLLELSMIENAASVSSYQLKVDLFAYKEKLFTEKLILKSSEQPSKLVNLVFHARVLGKGKGTPFLRNGIQSVGVKNDEDDSESSDWPGWGEEYRPGYKFAFSD